MSAIPIQFLETHPLLRRQRLNQAKGWLQRNPLEQKASGLGSVGLAFLPKSEVVMEVVNTKLRFNALANKWRRETRNLSSTSKKLANPAYRDIVGMGLQTIPWIIERLHDGPRHWFFALMEITGENPVDASLEGNLPAMVRAWEHWGKTHGKVA